MVSAIKEGKISEVYDSSYFTTKKTLKDIEASLFKIDTSDVGREQMNEDIDAYRKGTKKISDYLNDLKINSFEKAEQLILENRGKIVWVIGKRLDDRFKLTSKTKKVLKLCLK